MYPMESWPYIQDNAIPSGVAGNLVEHKAVGNLAAVARKVGGDIAVAAVHIEMDIEAEIAHMVETDTEIGCTVAMDTEAEDMVAMEMVDRVLTVEDMVFEDWCTDLILLDHTQVGCVDLCLPTCCHKHHKNVHGLHCVSRNLCSTQPQLVELQEYARHGRTEYKTLC